MSFFEKGVDWFRNEYILKYISTPTAEFLNRYIKEESTPLEDLLLVVSGASMVDKVIKDEMKRQDLSFESFDQTIAERECEYLLGEFKRTIIDGSGPLVSDYHIQLFCEDLNVDVAPLNLEDHKLFIVEVAFREHFERVYKKVYEVNRTKLRQFQEDIGSKAIDYEAQLVLQRMISEVCVWGEGVNDRVSETRSGIKYTMSFQHWEQSERILDVHLKREDSGIVQDYLLQDINGRYVIYGKRVYKRESLSEISNESFIKWDHTRPFKFYSVVDHSEMNGTVEETIFAIRRDHSVKDCNDKEFEDPFDDCGC